MIIPIKVPSEKVHSLIINLVNLIEASINEQGRGGKKIKPTNKPRNYYSQAEILKRFFFFLMDYWNPPDFICRYWKHEWIKLEA